jgi:N,N'-diacetyllegionaminate synthase
MFKKKIFIIAEAGVNHDGSLKKAYKLIDAAKNSCADAVKFQTWAKGEITGKFTNKVGYIKKNKNFSKISRYELSEKLRLDYKDFIKLNNYAKKKNIIFLTTPDGFQSLDFACKILKIKYIKIGSSELNHSAFIQEAAKYKKPIILSTGIGNFDEVKKAVKVVKKIHNKIVVLHCTSQYPAPLSDLNILSVKFLKDKLNLQVGLSDHSLGNTAAIMSVALGAKVIEKHITLSNKMKGPDHKSSLNPKNFKDFVNKIREAEKIVGEYKKSPTKIELKNLPHIRRGIVSKKNLQKGTILTKEMLVAKRPFVEIEPDQLKKLIGKKITKNFYEDQPIIWKYVKR